MFLLQYLPFLLRKEKKSGPSLNSAAFWTNLARLVYSEQTSIAAWNQIETDRVESVWTVRRYRLSQFRKLWYASFSNLLYLKKYLPSSTLFVKNTYQTWLRDRFREATSDHDFTTTLSLSLLLWCFCFGKFYNLFSTTAELNVENPPSHAISVWRKYFPLTIPAWKGISNINKIQICLNQWEPWLVCKLC